MRKKEDGCYKFQVFEGVQLFRDDLDLIFSLFKENGYEYELSDNDFIYDDLDDLKEHKGKYISELEISSLPRLEQSSINRIRIRIDQSNISLSVHLYDYANGVNIYSQLKDIFMERKVFLYKALNAIGLWLILGSVFIALIGIVEHFISQNEGVWHIYGIYFPWVIATFFVLGLIYFLHMKFSYPLILRRKHEGDFLRRNFDKIAVAIITSIITAFLSHLFS